MHPDRATDTPIGRLVGVATALSAVLAVIVLVFSWPAIIADPRDLPLAIAGPPPRVAAVTANVAQAQPGAVSFTTVADRDAAIAAIRSRAVYGAVVLGAQPEVLTASAASPAVAQLLNGIAGQLQRGLATQAPPDQPAPVVTVTDVVPLSTDDPRGTGFTAALFPLLLGGDDRRTRHICGHRWGAAPGRRGHGLRRDLHAHRQPHLGREPAAA